LYVLYQKGLVKKFLEISVFEADQNFQPRNSTSPLFVERVVFDEHKILIALEIIGGLDSGGGNMDSSEYYLKIEAPEIYKI